MKESPVFTKTHDLLRWLAPATRKFPREHRFGLGQHLLDTAFDLQRALTAAGLDRAHTAEHLIEADIALAMLRKQLLLCHELGLLSAGQYRHASTLTDAVGKTLGGWRKGMGA